MESSSETAVETIPHAPLISVEGCVMGSMTYTLEDEILAVFERACCEGDFEVAEHLLRALEAIAFRQRDEQQLDCAYFTLASTIR
ncbi:hypothetical protein [Burkholderia stagnalis]|uniref:hypothetical protein n=1 Tax=Burkholderia stagnalis TaxID=1503054 RepID=UPI001E50F623|nr:hypothetical protein [Burkholderia stagnalis]